MRDHILARLTGDERGVVAAFAAVGMVAFISVMALAIDLGMLMTARTEAQRTADGAALAGAASLLYSPNNADQARQWAKEWASQNPVRRQTVTLRDDDIDVLLAERKVRVRVLRTETYGGAVSTVFARMLGIDAVDVATVAAAEASWSGVGAECMLPVAIPDRWWNGDSNLEFDQPPDVYYPPSPDCSDPALRTPWCDLPEEQREAIGYTFGEEIVLVPSQGGRTKGKNGNGDDPPSTRLQPGYWNLWLPEGENGNPPIRERIRGCVEGDPVVAVGSDLPTIQGNKQSLVKEFEKLIENYDHHLVWEGGCAPDGPCANAAGGFHLEDEFGNTIYDSPRYRPVPMFDPAAYQGSNTTIPVSQIVGVFLTRTDDAPQGKKNVYAVILPWLGTMGGGPTAGPQTKALKLVE